MYKVFGYVLRLPVVCRRYWKTYYTTLAALTRRNTHDGLSFRTTMCSTPPCSNLIKISQPVERSQMQPCFCRHSRDMVVTKNDGRKASHQPINSPVIHVKDSESELDACSLAKAYQPEGNLPLAKV